MVEEVYANYASALYSLIDKPRQEEYAEALSAISDSFREDPALLRALSSYSLSKAEKESLIDKAFSHFELPHLCDFLKVISAHHRFLGFKQIQEGFLALVHEDLGIKSGVAYSADRLTASELNAIKEALGKRLNSRVELRNVVDPSLLGGVKVAIDGKVYDGTIRSKLIDLSRELRK